MHIAFVIFQYLEFSNFDKALVVFDEECSEKGKPVSPTDGQPKSDEKLVSVQVMHYINFHSAKILRKPELSGTTKQNHLANSIPFKFPSRQHVFYFSSVRASSFDHL